MDKLTDLLRRNGEILKLSADIDTLNALGTLARVWRDNEAALRNLNLRTAFELIARLQQQPALFTALGDLGLDADALRAQVDDLTARLGRLPEEYRKLLQPLGTFVAAQAGPDTGLVNWKLLDVAAGDDGGTELRYQLDIASAATLQLEAGEHWTVREGIDLDDLLRIGLSGELSTGARAALPLQGGNLSTAVGAAASTRLDYYFRAQDPDALFAVAAAQMLPQACNPFDLQASWKSLTRSGLEGVEVHLEGSASVDVEIGIVEGFTLARELAEATAGITVGASVNLTGEYGLQLRSLQSRGTAGIEVTLSRTRSRSRGIRAGIGVDVDLSGLAARIRLVLERHLGDFHSILEEYGDYLEPGSYIRQRLGAELKQVIDDSIPDNRAKSALKEAVGAVTGETRPPALSSARAFLAGEITSALDAAGEVVTGHARFVSTQVAKTVSGALGLDGTDIQARLAAGIEKLVTRVQGDLEQSIMQKADAQLDALLGKLTAVGAQLDAQAAKADSALQGVREIIGKYETLLKKLIDATTDAVRTRVTANLELEDEASSGTTIEACVQISQDTEATRAAFAALVRGDLNRIVKLLDDPVPGLDFDRERTALTRFAGARSSLGFDLVFLGFEFRSQSIFDADARVTADGTGKVQVQSNATWLRRRETPREQRQLRFVDAYELGAASQTGQFHIRLGISHQDESLKRREFIRFLRSFEAAKLLKPALIQSARSVFDELQPADDRALAADINIELRLDDRFCLRMLRDSERRNSDLPDASRREIFRVAVRELLEAGAIEMDSTVEAATTVLEQTRMGDSKPVVDILYDYTPRLHQRTRDGLFQSSPHAPRILRDLDEAAEIHRLGKGLIQFVETMGDIYEAKPAFEAVDGWTEEDFLEAQRRLDEGIRGWLRINTRFVFWIDDEAHPRTVAFVGALMALSEAVDETGQPATLSVTLVRRDGSGETIPLRD